MRHRPNIPLLCAAFPLPFAQSILVGAGFIPARPYFPSISRATTCVFCAMAWWSACGLLSVCARNVVGLLADR